MVNFVILLLGSSMDKTNYALQTEANLSPSVFFPVCLLTALCPGLTKPLSCTHMYTYQIGEERRESYVWQFDFHLAHSLF